MSLNVVLDHILSIKSEIGYIGSVLSELVPEYTSGRPMIAQPYVEIETITLDVITEISKSILVKISEIDNMLEHESWKPYTRHPLESSERFYAIVLRLNNPQFQDGSVLFDPLNNLHQSINNFEITIKINVARQQGNTSKKQYSETQISNQINELEKSKRASRLKMYRKLDPDLKTITKNTQTDNPATLDITASKLLHLMGFDTEIYASLSGNIDVIAVDRRYEIICIVESTTGKISKAKVDQIIGHQKEYEEEYMSWKNSKIYPILVCTHDNVFADALSRRHAIYNAVSIIAKKELEELLKNIKNGRINPTLFVEFIKKKIPKR